MHPAARITYTLCKCLNMSEFSSFGLYLASASPRRHELLQQIQVPHEVLIVPAPAGEDEPILPTESAVQYVQRTALEKLQQAVAWRQTQRHLQQDWSVLCADTTVELEGRIIGKPADLDEAAHILGALSGRQHRVHSACCLMHQNRIYQALSTSSIWFKELSSADITTYCQSGEPLGKAGAYGIQGAAAKFIQRLEGSYSSVMGLDLYQAHQLLRQAGLE